MNRAARVMSLTLAMLVVVFSATWITLPQETTAKVKRPASLFAVGGLAGTTYTNTCVEWRPKPGADYKECAEYEARPSGDFVDTGALRRRVFLLYGGSAVVVVLLGAVFGAGRQARP